MNDPRETPSKPSDKVFAEAHKRLRERNTPKPA
jgi:hypothetical protein